MRIRINRGVFSRFVCILMLILLGFAPKMNTLSASAGHLTSHWNIPQISWVSTSNVLTDKTLYPTYVRTLGPQNALGAGVLSIFYDFRWHKIGILHINGGIGPCQYAAAGVREWFYGTNITITQDISYTQIDLPVSQMDAYLIQLQKSSRIIFLCDEGNLRRYMIRACVLGMCDGEYVFMSAWTVESREDMERSKMWEAGDGDDDDAKHAFRYLIYLTTAQYVVGGGHEEELMTFEEDVILKTAEPPWNDDFALRNNLTASLFSPFLYDAIYFYGLWVNHSITTGTDVRDGRAMLNYTRGLSYLGMTGPVYFDDNGDRIPTFWIWDFTHEEGYPRIAAVVDTGTRIIETTNWKGFNWQTLDGRPPPDTPACGFFSELCITKPTDNTGVFVGVSLALLAAIALAVCIVYIVRKRQLENSMMKMIWKVDINEVELVKSKLGAGSRVTTSRSVLSLKSDTSAEKLIDGQALTTVGMLKGQLVAIKSLPNVQYNLMRRDLMELKEMRELQNDNINPFIGASLDTVPPSAFFVYCPKGSLQDILENDDIHLDMMFKDSLMLDLVNGMCFLHSSSLVSHGRLKSNNCLVDNRWMLKVTDYGMGRFLQYSEKDTMEEQQKYKHMLWTSPELLNLPQVPPNGSKAGDVYSFGIILHEIFYRMGPFAGNFDTTVEGIINKVKKREPTPFRPEIFTSDPCPSKAIMKLMKLCWTDNEVQRPAFSSIRSYVKQNVKNVNKNIVDVMVQRLEKYACNLEELVDQRTVQLMDEKRKTDRLLYRMLPESCAVKLKMGESVKPELFESATVFFSDIVGFTAIAGQSSPMEVVDLLNDLYTHIDEIIELYDAYKVETIGDAYLVVSGIPKRNGDLHAGVIADMSLDILSGLSAFRIRHLPHVQIMVRIGMHTGPCCAGVVGLSMPRYCLFGDTVNTASRMESNGERQKIHISLQSYLALLKLGSYFMTFRDELEIKGKGLMKTFWLEGKEGLNQDPVLVE